MAAAYHPVSLGKAQLCGEVSSLQHPRPSHACSEALAPPAVGIHAELPGKAEPQKFQGRVVTPPCPGGARHPGVVLTVTVDLCGQGLHSIPRAR